jgi:hypothetical protein
MQAIWILGQLGKYRPATETHRVATFKTINCPTFPDKFAIRKKTPSQPIQAFKMLENWLCKL